MRLPSGRRGEGLSEAAGSFEVAAVDEVDDEVDDEAVAIAATTPICDDPASGDHGIIIIIIIAIIPLGNAKANRFMA